MKTPVLSSDQKLRLLLAQRDVLSTERRHQVALDGLNAVAAEIVKELGIDPKGFTIDLNALVLTRSSTQ